MESGRPSRTAWGAAALRAAHQVLEQGRIFADPLALRIVGGDAEAAVRQAEEQPSSSRLRIFLAVRSRFAEDAVAAAVERGVQQLVVLGAGLDTYAYRSPFGARLRVFEVDHPATQAWKRERLAEAAIAPPEWLTFAPIDFERETLADGLAAAGFDPARQTFFTWLGVTPYLSEAAIRSTLGFIASVPGGAHVVFDYVNPPDSLTETNQADHHRIAERVQAMGEPWVTFFETAALRAKLEALGFGEVEDLGPREIASRYFPARADSSPEKGAHVVRVTTVPL